MGERPPETTRGRDQQTVIGVFVIFWGSVLLGYLCLRLYGVPEALARHLDPRIAGVLNSAVWLALGLLYLLLHDATKRRPKNTR